MDNTKIKSFIEDLLKSMNVAFDSVDINEGIGSSNKVFSIRTKESGLLIGEDGETFRALSHLIRRVAEKSIEADGKDFKHFDFSIDINDYQKALLESIKTKALVFAKRAADMKTSVEMDPMSSYERLVVHGALNDVPNIKTESIGDGKDRRVVIKYVENLNI